MIKLPPLTSYFSLPINKSFDLDRAGVNVRKSTYRSVRKYLGGAENEDNSELSSEEFFPLRSHKWSLLSRKILATFFILKSISSDLWVSVSVNWLLIF